MPGQPRREAAATTIEPSAKGSAKIVCDSFTNAAQRRTLSMGCILTGTKKSLQEKSTWEHGSEKSRGLWP